MKKIITFLCFSFFMWSQAFAVAPTNPSSNLFFLTTEGNSLSFGWTNGNGAKRIVIARKDNPVTAMPVNGVDYFGSSIFGSGNELSTGQFVIYNGSGSSATITNLVSGSVYYFAIIEYNGTGFSTEYLTTS